MGDLKKIDNWLGQMERAAEKIKELLPDFEWEHNVKDAIMKDEDEDPGA